MPTEKASELDGRAPDPVGRAKETAVRVMIHEASWEGFRASWEGLGVSWKGLGASWEIRILYNALMISFIYHISWKHGAQLFICNQILIAIDDIFSLQAFPFSNS